ncbi:MAG: hypothetical protein LBP87_02260 [Planctomycetaceae bacterium]|nr:hypothetical protein [Planctomycetaceae bacterium]
MVLVIYFYQSAFLALFAKDDTATDFGGKYLKQSIDRILSIKTIESDIRMDVYVDDVEYSARGRYEEQALPKPLAGEFLRSMYRLDINFLTNVPASPGSEPNRMTVVCHLSEDREQNQIWQYTSIEGEKTFNIIKISPVENAIKQSKKEPRFTQISEVRNLGGLAGQLRQIDRFYEFVAPAQPETLEEDDSILVWKITGTIRLNYFDDLIKQFGGLDKKKRYPQDFPSDIEIWIGRNDGFPYKIRYLNRPSEKSSKRTLLLQSSYFNVILDGEAIPSVRFATFEQGEYLDGVFGFQDITASFIQSLGL